MNTVAIIMATGGGSDFRKQIKFFSGSNVSLNQKGRKKHSIFQGVSVSFCIEKDLNARTSLL